MRLQFSSFRVQNFTSIDDSGPIRADSVTCFLGRNESGKTSLLRALHKFNPGTAEPYSAQKDFPRDRFNKEFRADQIYPACSVTFKIGPELLADIASKLPGRDLPATVTVTRNYDGSRTFEYDVAPTSDQVEIEEVSEALEAFEKPIRRATALAKEDRTALTQWTTELRDQLDGQLPFVGPDGVARLKAIRTEVNGKSLPEAAEVFEALAKTIQGFIARISRPSAEAVLKEAVTSALPVFIYFENYGILDSFVYLPRFLEDAKKAPNDPRIRTIEAMFKLVGLSATDLLELGREGAETHRVQGNAVPDSVLSQDQQRKELRAIKLNSASIEITKQFQKWYGQRRHTIEYQADGDYFRIWVTDNKRPGVKIELESRSKGFQWFFSFFLVFLVESEEGHKDSVLLLDEPGLNLHPTAQQELIKFFERLSEKNQLLYSTHSPFLIDGDHLERVRAVVEDDSGHSRVSDKTWPSDYETIFPLQAAAGYAMVRALFQGKKNVLVEGLSDYLILHALSIHCRASGRTSLPDDTYLTPCGGTKNVGYLASLFLGQEVRPVVLMDSDQAGRDRQTALEKELFAGHDRSILLVGDAIGSAAATIEDVVGEGEFLEAVNAYFGEPLVLNDADRAKGALVDQVESAADRTGRSLHFGWKAGVAQQLAVRWSTMQTDQLPSDMLDRAEALFNELGQRFPASA